jgi:CRISPR-associated endonuclease Cas3-HD
MEELLSHPGKLFEDHVRDVIKIGGKIIETFGPENKEKKEKYFNILKYIAFFHDLGKLTEENQQKIKNSERLAHGHSNYGEIIFNIFWNFSKKGNEESDIDKIVSFVIRYHHTNFKNFDDKNEKLWSVDEEDKKRIKEILSKVDRVIIKLKDVFTEEEINHILQCKSIDLNSAIVQLQEKEDEKLKVLKFIKGLESFIDVTFVASVFFIADRASASKISHNEIEEEINNIFNSKTFSSLLEKFESYIKEKLVAVNEIDYKRKKYYEKTIDAFKKKFGDTRVYKIFLPTGIGKTYIGVRIALEISNKYNIPIIYSLPFINIIDQIYDRLDEIFNDKNTEIVSKLHHLSVIERGDEYSPLGDIINFKLSPILITTFVQVFHSLFAVERDFLLRLPLLLNSCIIIDEVQAVDPKFYTPFEELIKTLSNMGFRTRIVIMSATMPPLFSQNNKEDFAVEITSGFRDECYKLFNRYKIKIKNGEISLEEYQHKLRDKIFGEYADKHSIGIICNKVDEAKRIFEFIKNFLGEDGEYFTNDKMLSYYEKTFYDQIEKKKSDFSPDEIDVMKELGGCVFRVLKETNCIGYYSRKHKTLLIYLAANLIDASKINRSRILVEVMRKIKHNNFSFPVSVEGKEINRLIVVSTQVIEAGVDFDFEVVFRSFAPFESIIQTAGRANRNDIWKSYGEVEVYKVVMNNKPTFDPIYPKFLINGTEKLFFPDKLGRVNEKDIIIEEKDVLNLAEKYLRELNYMRKEKLIEHLTFMKFEEISKKFRIIEYALGSFNFILDPNSNVFNKIEEIKELIKDKDYKKKKFIYRRIIPYVYFLQAKTYLKEDGLNKLLGLIKSGKVKIYFTSTVKREKIDKDELLRTDLLFIAEKSIYDSLTGFNFVGDNITYIL